jgi:hypothetical protein
MHTSFGSPAISTFQRAVRKGYLYTPRLTSSLVSKHKPNSEATAKGHLDRRRQGLDSTTAVPVVPPKPGTSTGVIETTYDDDIQNIPDEATATIDDDSTVYVQLFYTADFDAASRFPVASSGSRFSYHLVSCYNGNIHVETMQTRTSAAYIAAYELTFQHWSRYGSVPSFVRLDNETSNELENFLLNEKKVTFQYFPTGTHRANRAERCICTWKNHFIVTLATTSPKFSILQWHKLLPLAELTLNCLLPWHPNPATSAYHGLTGTQFDFRAHPIAPAGTAMLIHEPPTRITRQLGQSRSARFLSRPCSVPLSLTSRICDRYIRHSHNRYSRLVSTDITPPLPDTNEILIVALTDLLHEVIPLTLAQELQDLATLHNAPTIDLSSAPESVQKKVGITRRQLCTGRKGGVTYFSPSEHSSHCFSGPATSPSTSTNNLPTATRLATSSRHGSP